ncbi:MAG TPA: integral membrane glycosyltransferase, partial [Bacteroidetes bacterium]|nr:integral membrane glycosyltransferase [Bacteroidota bacterium]
MKRRTQNSMWYFSQSADITNLDRFILLFLSIAGILSIFDLAEWWFRADHILNFPLFVILSTFFWYGFLRTVLIWINYLRIKKPDEVPVPEEGLSVAVFITSAPGEPISMFEKSLYALQKVEYAHNTYLLDSTEDPEFEKLA